MRPTRAKESTIRVRKAKKEDATDHSIGLFIINGAMGEPQIAVKMRWLWCFQL